MQVSKLLSGLIIAAVFTSCSEKSAQNTSSEESIPVTIVNVGAHSGAETIETSGYLTTDDEVQLSFGVNGIVSGVYVNKGDAVRKGQLLAIIDPVQVKAREQQALLKKEMASRNFTRTSNLFAEKVANEEQFQNDRSLLDIATKELELAQFERKHSEIRAVKDGYVTEKYVESGATVSAGTPVISMYGGQSHDWMVKVQVSDTDWMNIRNGDAAKIFIGDKIEGISGTVKQKSRSAENGSGAYTIDVALKSKGNKTFAQGMFAKVTIASGKKQNTQSSLIKIPFDALTDADGNTGYVFIPTGSKRVKKVAVTIEDMVADGVIINTHEQPLTQIILAGSAYLNENSLYKETKTINNH